MARWLGAQSIALIVAVGCGIGLLVGHESWTHFLLAGVGVTSLPVLLFVRELVIQHRLAAAARSVTISVRVDGVDLRRGPLEGRVFVAGVRRPEIFCDGEVLDRLGARERRAVLAHEAAHVRAGDPRRRAMIVGIGRVLTRLPGGPAFVEHAIARTEIRADLAAIAAGVSRSSLAAALLAVPVVERRVVGYATAAELRLHALVGEDPLTPPSAVAPALATGLLLFLSASVLLGHHVLRGDGFGRLLG